MTSSRVPFWIAIVVSFLILITSSVLCAQNRFIGRRVIAIVPIIGDGTPNDPLRPRFAPGPKDREVVDGLDYQFAASDDGKWAIVIFCVTRPSEASLKLLDRIEGSKDDGAVAFDLAKTKRADLETEIRKKKSDFDLDDFLGLSKGKGKN